MKGLTAFLRSASTRTAATTGDDLSDMQQDAVALLANASYELNMLRKSLIRPDINTRYTHLCKPSVKTTQWLFGDDLHKTVKEMDEQQKTVGAIRGRTTSRPRYNPYQYHQGPRAGVPGAPYPSQRYATAGWTRTHPKTRMNKPFLGGKHLPAQTYTQATGRAMSSQRQPRYRVKPPATATQPDRRPAHQK